ncbi:MAG: hypothetical protein DMG41_05395 [Acidobacteria bacterium]|nr:MAG: hypothetical protein DMG42_11075 [Acidobacteriota bacterium]PYT90181.1 MAG: hypothetical protein DMG41_05395 [Acidobacteriota bacterium]PYU55318.1 MAG: hypothetical protein DMG55_28040 [Acidobacteriota bacterium]
MSLSKSKKPQSSGTSPTTALPAVSEPILTIGQVAERLQMEVSTVRELLRKRNRRPLPSLKCGKFLRFKWSLIEQWLDESRRAA